MVNIIRSILFNISFYGFTLIYGAFGMLPLCLFSSDRPLRGGIYIYCRVNLWLARWVLGVKQSFRGADLLPKEGAFILAAAHQSYMDPMMAYMLRQDVTALAKKELFSIPIIGSLLYKIKAIRIDRESGKARTQMQEVVQQALDRGRPIIIYPQATRVRPYDRKTLKSGAFFLQQSGDLPVYTVATTTGAFWTKGFWHKKGHAIFEVVRGLPRDLDKDAFMAAVEEDIVFKSEALFEEVGVMPVK